MYLHNTMDTMLIYEGIDEKHKMRFQEAWEPHTHIYIYTPTVINVIFGAVVRNDKACVAAVFRDHWTEFLATLTKFFEIIDPLVVEAS